MAVGAVLKAGARGKQLARNFANQIKARAGKARQWFRDAIQAAKKTAMPGSTGRRQYMNPDGNVGNPSTPDIPTALDVYF